MKTFPLKVDHLSSAGLVWTSESLLFTRCVFLCSQDLMLSSLTARRSTVIKLYPARWLPSITTLWPLTKSELDDNVIYPSIHRRVKQRAKTMCTVQLLKHLWFAIGGFVMLMMIITWTLEPFFLSWRPSQEKAISMWASQAWIDQWEHRSCWKGIRRSVSHCYFKKKKNWIHCSEQLSIIIIFFYFSLISLYQNVNFFPFRDQSVIRALLLIYLDNSVGSFTVYLEKNTVRGVDPIMYNV